MMDPRHVGLIYNACEVVAHIHKPFEAIYFIDCGEGYVETDIENEGEFLEFSCHSKEEFKNLCKELEVEYF